MIAVLGGTVLAVAGAIALSPLAPVGPVRRYDPDHGVHGDWAIVGPGARYADGATNLPCSRRWA